VIKTSTDRIGTHCEGRQKKGKVSSQNKSLDLKAETLQETEFKLLNMKSYECSFVKFKMVDEQS
jgi:hypothetical protein